VLKQPSPTFHLDRLGRGTTYLVVLMGEFGHSCSPYPLSKVQQPRSLWNCDCDCHCHNSLLQAPGSSRDLLLLDIALESWLRMLVERQDKRSLSGDDLVELMALVLGNAALAGTSSELELVAAQWEAVRSSPDRYKMSPAFLDSCVGPQRFFCAMWHMESGGVLQLADL